MAEDKLAEKKVPEPRGFGEHTKGLAGEYAHEQGWGLNEAERTAVPEERQPTYGGGEYDYGARDFGDEATDMTGTHGTAEGLEKDVEKALGGATQGGGGVTTETTKDAGQERSTLDAGTESANTQDNDKE